MVLSGGIATKRFAIEASSVLLTCCLLAGCSQQIDAIRPELNNEGMMQTGREALVVDFEDTKIAPEGMEGGTTAGDKQDQDDPFNSSGSRPDGSNSGITNNPGYNDTYGEGLEYAPVQEGFIASSNYKQYLEEELVSKMQELLNGVPIDQRSKLYFRVVHSGYDLQSGTQAAYSVPAYTFSSSTSLNRVSGIALTSFANDYLRHLDKNSAAIKNAKEVTLTKLEKYCSTHKPPSGQSWDNIDWLTASTLKDFPKDILSIWGGDRLNDKTLGSYKSLVQSGDTRAVPNIKLQYHSSSGNSNQYSTLTLNNCKTSGISGPFDYGMPKRDIDKLFTSVNQFTNRSATPTTQTYQDDGAIMFTHFDGYNKTVVLLGTEPGTSLSEILGSSYGEAHRLVTGLAAVTDVNRIPDKYLQGGTALVQSGYKGVD